MGVQYNCVNFEKFRYKCVKYKVTIHIFVFEMEDMWHNIVEQAQCQAECKQKPIITAGLLGIYI